jgi:hypothetical protein
MNKVFLAFIVLWLASLACGASVPKTVDDYMQEYGGNPDVYNRILLLTDCTLLQEEFDIASENNQGAVAGTAEHKETTGYMVAADARMKELDCYSQADVSQIIAQTAQMASTQTAMSILPTVAITSTNLPTLTQPAVIVLTAMETSSVTVVPTLAPINFPTNTVVFILPTRRPAATNPPAGGTCSCSGDSRNCGDFSSQSSAQACMNYCVSIGAGDIHNLDGDADGVACEGLP